VEKRKPSHDLERFKAVCGDPQTLSVTAAARRGGLDIGYGLTEIAALIRTMNRGMFFKSMTSFGDHRQWQDVYHVPTGDLTVYLKFTDDLLTEFTVLSFKEK